MDPASFGILIGLCASVALSIGEIGLGLYNSRVATPRRVKKDVLAILRDPRTWEGVNVPVAAPGPSTASQMALAAHQARDANDVRAAETRAAIVSFLLKKGMSEPSAMMTLKGLEGTKILTRHHLIGAADWVPLVVDHLQAKHAALVRENPPSQSTDVHAAWRGES